MVTDGWRCDAARRNALLCCALRPLPPAVLEETAERQTGRQAGGRRGVLKPSCVEGCCALDGGSLDDGLGLFLDRLVGAEDCLPDDRAENPAEEGTDPEHPDPQSQAQTGRPGRGEQNN